MDGLYNQLKIALHQVWRRRWLAAGVAWGVAILGWLVIALIPNSYEAKARLFVQTQSILPTVAGTPIEDRNNQLLRLKQTITSNENLVRVVRRTELNSLVASDRDLAAVVAALRTRITITSQPDGALEIKATSNISGFSNGQNARTAAGTVQGLVDLFTENNLAGDGRETGQSLQVLDEELRRREGPLREAEQRRVEFEQRYLGVLPGTGSIQDRMGAARTELANLDQQIAAGQASLNAMRGQLAATPQTIPGMAGDNNGTASGQIAQLQGQINQNLSRGWTESHPDIVYARQQIARLRPYAASERSSGNIGGMSNPSYTSLRAMMAEREAAVGAATARRNQLQADLASLTTRQSTEPGVAAEQSRIVSDYNALKLQYDQILANREQVRLRRDLQSRSSPLTINVVEAPSVPSAPAAPNRPIFLTLVLMFAIGAGLAAAFVAGQIQTTFPTPLRLAQVTGLKVLGTVSEVVNAAERFRRRKKLVLLAGTAGGLGAAYCALMLVEFWQRGSGA
ncbi:MAG: protein tyrosine kinase modulator [Sphingomonadales bacterium]|jgi:polysaccharide chain length determinant protein (PEP-CTERM system associated)|nr:protein tyrosine kinase modulator [Sphingomonadales bacterium]